MIYMIDIDNTICDTVGTDYVNSKPRKEVIDKINMIFDMGHTIKIFTGRGSVSGKDLRDLTESQLNSWGVKYHVLIFGKPSADYIIDDLMLSINDFLNINPNGIKDR